ncbi:MAG: hypothetical protein Aurels2KO_21480 [Aureliella sp.]
MRSLALGILLLSSFGCEQRYDSPPIKPSSPKITPAPNEPSSTLAGISILAWNIESGGSSTRTILQQLASDMPKADILALSEVPPEDVSRFAAYYPEGDGIACDSSGSDRLTIAWNDRFELVRRIKLNEAEFAPGRHRAPLIVHLRETATERDFIVMNNHLARGNAELRTKQAQMMVDWARNQALPIVAVGDYNMDYDFPTQKGNEAFSAMLIDGIYKWVKPNVFVDTNWSDRDGDGKDNYPDSMLDFVLSQAQPKVGVCRQKLWCFPTISPTMR